MFFKDSDGFGYTLTDFYDAGQLDDVVAKPSDQYNNSIRKPIMPLDNKGINGSDYKRRGSIEHQAHEVIQPNLVNFIETGDKKYLKKAKIDANKEYDKHGHWLWNKGKD